MQNLTKYNIKRVFEREKAMERIMETAARGGNISEVTIAELERISAINNLEAAV